MLYYVNNISTSLTCYCKYVKFIVHIKNNYSDKEKHKKQDCLMGDRTAKQQTGWVKSLIDFPSLIVTINEWHHNVYNVYMIRKEKNK